MNNFPRQILNITVPVINSISQTPRMPTQDPNLYGQRPTKKQRTALAPSSSAMDFSAQLMSAMAECAASEPPRSRHSKPIQTLFKESAEAEEDPHTKRLKLKKILQTHEEGKQLELSRKRLEEKAKIYNAMKRGDYVPAGKSGESLVDFDRKWAEAQESRDPNRDSDSESDSSFEGSDDDEMIEITDEFGRTRQVSRAEKRKIDRREMRGIVSDQVLGDMSARPVRPKNVIYGDYIQTKAFVPADEKAMEELAKKRDRSATPPPATHYDGDWEIRDKGVGFYKFSKDEKKRAEEMEGLEKERKSTEEKRKVLDAKKEARKKEIEQRRKEIESRRAQKKADNFLNSL